MSDSPKTMIFKSMSHRHCTRRHGPSPLNARSCAPSSQVTTSDHNALPSLPSSFQVRSEIQQRVADLQRVDALLQQYTAGAGAGSGASPSH